MATISAATNEKIYGIKSWGGLNEHPDGDTRLKMGEASKMVNFRITRDGNLKRRPGTEFVAGLNESYVAVVSHNMTKLSTFKAGDTVTVFRELSTDFNPGTITLGGNLWSFNRGTFQGLKGTLTGGTFTLAEDADAEIVGGRLRKTGTDLGQTVTMAELAGLLEELEDGEYLYLEYDEVVYALTPDCLIQDGGAYSLNGYRVTAEDSEGGTHPVAGMWTGLVGGREVFLAAGNGCIWSLYDAETDRFQREFVGEIETDKGVTFFPFDNKVYILDGHDYYVWDGETFGAVEGYRPLVVITLSPVIDNDGNSESGETTGEYINRLNGERRVWLSPDGERKTFQMPEKNLRSFDYIRDLATGELITPEYTADLTAGQITFTVVPDKGVNSLEVGYSVSTTFRDQVTGNRFAEIFAGNTDAGVFIYGDGTNRALYTGMDYDGLPRADYFPDQYEVHVGESNTPITAMVRHYGVLMCYKTDSAWALGYGSMELASGDATVSITCTPVNRDKGNLAPGQVCLVDNSPVTCSGTELYRWTNSSYYTSSLTRDERQADRISDRVQRSVKDVDLPNACMWDDNDNQEFYIAGHGLALVWNYALDVWYRYENFDAVKMCSFHGEVYTGTSDGKIRRVTDTKMGDEGVAIHAVWESGAMDFGAGYLRKYAAMLWVGLKPESGTSVDVCVETDRKNTFREKVVSSEKAKIHGQPFMVKTKIKAKKFVYYRLILSVDTKMPPVTVTDIQIRVRQTGYAK